MTSRIGIDIQAMIGRPAGVGSYVRGLVHGLSQIGGPEEYRLFYFDFLRRGCGLDISDPRFRFKPIRFMPGRFYEKFSRSMNRPDIGFLAGRYDLYHFPNYVIPPLSKGKAVVTVCDLSFVRFPEYAEERNLKRLERRFNDTLKRADAVITISEFSKKELMELYGVEPERITVTHLAAGIRRSGATGREFPPRYFLFVGTIEPRKNLGNLLEAWRIARDRRPGWDYKLAIAGGFGWKDKTALQQVRDAGIERDAIVLDYVAEEDLSSLYGRAEALVFPSLYEGFGLPVLEAMAMGTPVLASRAPAIPEVAGDAAIYFDANDPGDMADAILRISGDGALREEMSRRGLDRARLFSWKETAGKTLAVYRGLLK